MEEAYSLEVLKEMVGEENFNKYPRTIKVLKQADQLYWKLAKHDYPKVRHNRLVTDDPEGIRSRQIVALALVLSGEYES